MIRDLCLTAFALLLSCTPLPAAESADTAQATELSLASDVWPPFTDTFKQTRFAIDIVHSALERAGIKAETEILDEWTVPADIKDGKFDGSGAIWKTPERENYLIYSQPYLENRRAERQRRFSKEPGRSDRQNTATRQGLCLWRSPRWCRRRQTHLWPKRH